MEPFELAAHEVAAPVRKEPGAPIEIHQARLGAAGTVLDVVAYVDDFNSTVVDAYRRGISPSSFSTPASAA